MSAPEAIITALDLSRWYGIVMGLNNITVRIPPGLTGLVGPNGAGKSTLIKIITGQLRPSSGELRVLGQLPWNNPSLLRRIGYCPEDEALPDELTPLLWLESLGLISGIASADVGGRCRDLLHRVKLAEEHWHKTLGQYSKGMRQRVKLAQALLHTPQLLVLDEPMNGLDPMGRQEMQLILQQLAAEGVSILISSHILPELESLCPHVVILNWGRVMASGSQADLRAQLPHALAGKAAGADSQPTRYYLRSDAPRRLVQVLFAAGLLEGFEMEADGLTAVHLGDPQAFHDQLPELLAAHGIALYELRSQDRSLQDIFNRITR